jgi:Ca2+-binding RTX toxin-like protein
VLNGLPGPDPLRGGRAVLDEFRGMVQIIQANPLDPDDPLGPDRPVRIDSVMTSDDPDPTLYGTGGRNRLTGTGDADVIAALGGRDRLSGAGGRDTLLCGADRFMFRTGHGADRITDFGRGDRIHYVLDGLEDVNPVAAVLSRARVTDAGVLFDFGGGDSLLLEGRGSLQGLDRMIVAAWEFGG